MRPVDFMAEHDDGQLRELLAPLCDGTATRSRSRRDSSGTMGA
jgi:hypothetical protein